MTLVLVLLVLLVSSYRKNNLEIGEVYSPKRRPSTDNGRLKQMVIRGTIILLLIVISFVLFLAHSVCEVRGQEGLLHGR